MLIKKIKTNPNNLFKKALSHILLVIATSLLVVSAVTLASESNTPTSILSAPPVPSAPIDMGIDVVPVPDVPHNPKTIAYLIQDPKPESDISTDTNAPEESMEKIKIIPIVRVAPYYPRQAAIDKITGYVTVDLDILPNGHVGDVRVVESQPVGTFEKQAINSVKKYKFAPIAQTVSVRQKVEFKLD